jgi:hypothetical protein
VDEGEFVDVEVDDCAANVPVPVRVVDATLDVPVEESSLQKLWKEFLILFLSSWDGQSVMQKLFAGFVREM